MTYFYGFKREEWLELPHWELWDYIKAIFRISAFSTIPIIRANTLTNSWAEIPNREKHISSLYSETELFGSTINGNSSVKEKLKNASQLNSKLKDLVNKENPQPKSDSWVSKLKSFTQGI